MLGRAISHYTVRKRLGAGGMGEVYLAYDQTLNRLVALKILPAEFVSDHSRLNRFLREARATSAVSHPNVAHIYEIGDENGIHFIAMEFIDGESLAQKMSRDRIHADEMGSIALQILDALECAHSKGITHRDIKPANIMMSGDLVKLVDFGLAKMEYLGGEFSSILSTESRTEIGKVIGTLPYMSPEQVLGHSVDHRSDIFSLGVVLYQMATGELPFAGKTTTELADSIVHKDPISIRQRNPGVPQELTKTISWMLRKDPNDRPQNVSEITAELKKLRAVPSSFTALSTVLRKPFVVVPAILILILVCSAAVLLFNRYRRIEWARVQALPEIARLADQGKFKEAVTLAMVAEKVIPHDPFLNTLWQSISSRVTIRTDPPGAKIFIQEYGLESDRWTLAGTTPVEKMRLPKGYFRLKVSGAGFPEILAAVPRAFWESDVERFYPISHYKDPPKGMVRIPGVRSDPPSRALEFMVDVEEDFWMDEYEVTNEQFQGFVDAGGYRDQKFWKIPFVKEGRILSFDEAMKYFRDSTGRPGPGDWEVGHYPRGKEQYPVTGVSWYEAAAFAEFAGKSLPTLHHWQQACGADMNYQIIPVSNFGGVGPLPSGTGRGLGPYGTYDMAGNVSEWCWNESSGNQRTVQGGSYQDPAYMFIETNNRPPFDRDPSIGFRCALYLNQDAFTPALFQPFEKQVRDYTKESPVDDEVFSVLKTFYDYTKTDLEVRKESVQEEQYVIRERITLKAPYKDERMTVHVFLPQNVPLPYQTVVFFPGSAAQFFSSSEQWVPKDFADYGDFIVRSGRTFVYPIYKGTYERGGGPGSKNRTPEELREWRIQYVKDIRRTIDYLETRNDIDKKKMAYYGMSWGSRVGCFAGALDNRFKVMILEHGGLPFGLRTPETDEINFVPRVKIPVLMVNGSLDHVFPVATSQKPMFDLLGTPEKDKVHHIFEGGHITPRKEIIRLTLDWLDKHLGPTSQSARN